MSEREKIEREKDIIFKLICKTHGVIGPTNDTSKQNVIDWHRKMKDCNAEIVEGEREEKDKWE